MTQKFEWKDGRVLEFDDEEDYCENCYVNYLSSLNAKLNLSNNDFRITKKNQITLELEMF